MLKEGTLHKRFSSNSTIIYINPLVPRVEINNNLQFNFKSLLIVEFAEKMVYLGAHYNERQGLMG